MMPAKTITVTDWGGGMGIMLPEDFAEVVGIKNESEVQARVEGGAIIIVPVKKARRHVPLAERMEKALQDGKPYEITKEDRDWTEMPSSGEEAAW